ncbi:MAG: MFS transporter [Anaerovorax sp.]
MCATWYTVIMMNDFSNWKRRIAVFIISQTITLFGSSIVSFAVVWYITLKTSSGSLMMISVLCNFLPQILISLFAGVFADQYNRKWLIIGSDLFIAAVTLLLAILMSSGHESWGLIFFVCSLRSIGAGLQTPSVNALLPQLVPTDQLMRVTAINTTINSVSMLASPAVGGILLGIWNLQGALFFDVITAIIGTSILVFLKIPHYHRLSSQSKTHIATCNPIESNEKSGIFEELKAGLTYAKNHILIRKLLFFYALFFFLVTPVAFLSPILVERTFGAQVWMLTANEIAWSFGCVIGGIIISFLGGFKNRIVSMIVSCIAFGIFYIFLGLASNLWIYLGVMFLSGTFIPLYNTAETVLIQESVEEGMLGRVFSLIQIIITAIMPLGMVIFGPLADMVSVQSLLMVSGVLTIALGLYFAMDKNLLKLGTAQGRLANQNERMDHSYEQK